jgi:hypothetical protein
VIERRQRAALAALFCVVALAPAVAAQEASTRIARPANSLLSSAPASQWFQKKLDQYACPDLCPMVLCNGACCGRDDACAPFSGHLVLDPHRVGCLVTERSCTNVIAPPAVSAENCSTASCCQGEATTCSGVVDMSNLVLTGEKAR